MTKKIIKPGYLQWLDITNYESAVDSVIHTTARDLKVLHLIDNTFIVRIPHGPDFDVHAYSDDDGKVVLCIESDAEDNAFEEHVFNSESDFRRFQAAVFGVRVPRPDDVSQPIPISPEDC